MNYINTDTLQYPVTQEMIMGYYPNTSFPPDWTIAPEPFVIVNPNPKPDFDPVTQQCREDKPVLVDGLWMQGWRVHEIFQTQEARDAARAAAAYAAAMNVKQAVVAATQKRLDDFAKTRQYDGILSACTYAPSPSPKFAGEGQYCVNMRDATWAALYAFMAQVEAGQHPMPTGFADVEPVLPALEWPV
jgi:hypothetical protein